MTAPDELPQLAGSHGLLACDPCDIAGDGLRIVALEQARGHAPLAGAADLDRALDAGRRHGPDLVQIRAGHTASVDGIEVVARSAVLDEELPAEGDVGGLVAD